MADSSEPVTTSEARAAAAAEAEPALPAVLEQKKIKALVVDANGLIKAVRLDTLADKFYTTREVIGELRDKATREKLATGLIELEYRDPTPEALKAVMAFARKTGDYASLSSVDLRVLALTWTLEKELKGSVDHLRTEPVRSQPRIRTGAALARDTAPQIGVVGVAYPAVARTSGPGQASTAEGGPGAHATAHTESAAGGAVAETQETETDTIVANSTSEGKAEAEAHAESEDEREEAGEEEDSDGESGVDEAHEGEDEDEGFVAAEKSKDAPRKPRAEVRELADDEGWITPSNIHKVNKNFDPFGNVVAEARPDVACLTTDFAMQNVLIQMGLAVVSLDGMLIRRAKTFVLRCHACYHVTTNMDKQFCPSCGNGNTLVKIAASVDRNGQTQYHTMRTRKTNLRGTKYSLPAPKGGRHAQNIVLRQDQKEYLDAVQRQQRWERALEKGSDLLADEYMAKGSPFGTSGPHERAQIGFGRRNPNEVKRTGNRKKKSTNRH